MCYDSIVIKNNTKYSFGVGCNSLSVVVSPRALRHEYEHIVTDGQSPDEKNCMALALIFQKITHPNLYGMRFLFGGYYEEKHLYK